MMNIDFASLSSPLQKLDGRTKLIALLGIFILALLFSQPYYVLGCLSWCWLSGGSAGCRGT